MMRRKIAMMLLAFAVFLPCVFALTACGDKEQDNAKVSSISVEFNAVEYELIDDTLTIPYGQKLDFDSTDFKVIAHLDNGKNEEVSFQSASTSGYTFTSTLPTECDITPRGEYTITFSYLEHEIVVNVNVVKATVDMTEVEWNYDSAFTYDGDLKEVSLINVPQGVTVNYSGNSATDAGTRTAIATFTYVDTENYNPIDSMELSWTISPIAYVVDEDEITINSYDFTYDATEKQVTLNTTGLDDNVEIDEITGLTATGAGVHTIRITFNYVGESPNYDRVTPVQLTWEIKQANLTITANDASITYGEAGSNNNVEYDGFVGDEDASDLTGSLSYDYVDYEVGSPVGEYNIVPSGLSSNNYNIQYVNGKLKVNKADLIIKANDHSIDYNQPANHNGVTPTGLKAGDTLADLEGELDYSYNYEVGDDVDEYEISVSGLTSNNYNIQYQTGKLIVNKIDVDTTGVSLKQDTFTYTGEEIVVEVDNTTLPADIFDVNIKGDTGTTAGNYTAQITLTHKDTINYNPTTFELDWTIEKADADLSGVALKANEFDYNGLTQAIELINVPSYAQIASIEGNERSNAGHHEIEVIFVNQDTQNYNVFEIVKNFEWVINAVKLTITANDNTVEYSDEAQHAGVKYEGFVNGEDETDLHGSLVFDFVGYEKTSDANTTYPIKPSGFVSNNYNIQYVSGTLTVIPKPVDLTGLAWHVEDEYTYNGLPIRVFLDNLPQNVLPTYQYGVQTSNGFEETTPTNVGTYIAKVQLSPEKNYVLINGATEMETSYIINPIEVDLTGVDWVGESEYVYTGEVVKPVLNVTTLPYTEISYSYILDETEGKGGVSPSIENPTDVGTYRAWTNLQLPDDINYIFVNNEFVNPFTYDIIKADIDLTKLRWQETLSGGTTQDLITYDSNVYDEEDGLYAWDSAVLQDNGQTHTLSIANNTGVELDIRYEGDNEVIDKGENGYYLDAFITLNGHRNYNDFAIRWTLGYNLYSNPFATMAINGRSVDFREFANFRMAQIGTTLTFTLRSGYLARIYNEMNYITCDNGVYTMQIDYSTVNYYEVLIGHESQNEYDYTFGISIKPYILNEIEIDGKACKIIEKYGYQLVLDYGQDGIDINIDQDDFNKLDLYYTIHRLDGNYDTFDITTASFTIGNATNIDNFTIYCRNKGQDEMAASFDVQQFTPFEKYVVNKVLFNGTEETNYIDIYSQSIDVYNGIITGIGFDWKAGYSDWGYKVFADRELQTDVNWLDIDSLDKIYIAAYTPDGQLFAVRELMVGYRLVSTYMAPNGWPLEINVNIDNEREYILNEEDGVISIGFDNSNEQLVVSTTLNGEAELTLTDGITKATFRLEIEYNYDVYFVERVFTIFKARSHQSTLNIVTFTDNNNNIFYTEDGVLYIADMTEFEENLQNLTFECAYGGYEVTNTEIVNFEGEKYLKITLTLAQSGENTGSGEDGEGEDTGVNEGDGNGTENGEGSGNEEIIKPGIGDGSGTIIFPMGYNATSSSNQIYTYIKVCVNEEFNTDTSAVVRVFNSQTSGSREYWDNNSTIVIADRTTSELYIDHQNRYLSIIITDSNGNEVIPNEMDSYKFGKDGVYTLSIRALKGDAIIYTIHVGDVSGGEQPEEPEQPQEPVELFRVVVGEQTLIQQQIGNTRPTGDFVMQEGNNSAVFTAQLLASAWNNAVGDYLTINSFTSPYLSYGYTITDFDGNVISSLTNFSLELQTDQNGVIYSYFKVVIGSGNETMQAEFYLQLPEKSSEGGGENSGDEQPVELFRVVVGSQILVQQQIGDSAPTGSFVFNRGETMMFTTQLSQEAWEYVVNDYLTIASLTSPYIELGAIVTNCKGDVITNYTNFDLEVQTGDNGASYAYFKVTISASMMADFYLYLPEKIDDGNEGDNTGGGSEEDGEDPGEQETIELFRVVVGGRTLTQQIIGDVSSGDFKFEYDKTEEIVGFIAQLDASAWNYTNKGYLTITSFTSIYLEAGAILKDVQGNTINTSSSFDLPLILTSNGEASVTLYLINQTETSTEQSIICLILPAQSGGDGNLGEGDNAGNEGQNGYYDDYISIYLEDIYEGYVDFDVNNYVINIVNWNSGYCLESSSTGPGVYVQLFDSEGSELTGDKKSSIKYCFQEAGAYSLKVLDTNGEVLEEFTLNISGGFEPIIEVEFGELLLSQSNDENWEPINGNFTYTMNAIDEILVFKGYLGAEAQEKIRGSMTSMYQTLTIDSINSIYPDKLYYDIDGTNPIESLENVALNVLTDEYGNMYVTFYIVGEFDYGGYTEDQIISILLYLCSREEYVESLDYPLTIDIGTNSLEYRFGMNDIGEFGDFSFDHYYSGIPYVELERNSLALVDEIATVNLIWSKAYQDYSYCVLSMEGYSYLMSQMFTFEELVEEGLIYNCSNMSANTASTSLEFSEGMAMLMVGLEGLTEENAQDMGFIMLLFLIKGEATFEDFANMMDDYEDGGASQMAIPDITITVGNETLSSSDNDFMIENGQLFGFLNATHEQLIEISGNTSYIIVDEISIAADCIVYNKYREEISFIDAEVDISNYIYGLCAEIQVELDNGNQIRIFLVFSDSM